jgi:hypothetical protein
MGTCTTAKRPRGEKKPIPEDQKDEKYYERRKRNNQAAKKSRDARKIREDQVRPSVCRGAWGKVTTNSNPLFSGV